MKKQLNAVKDFHEKFGLSYNHSPTVELEKKIIEILVVYGDRRTSFDEIKLIKNDIHVLSKVKCDGKTGVEMEALTAVSVSCLTIYDMLKGLDKNTFISNIQLLKKSGGKSGDWKRK